MIGLKIKSPLIEAHIVKKEKDKIEYLLLKRSSDQMYPNIWQMVTGKIRDNEQAYETVIREINEETGLDVMQLFVVPKINSFYNDADNSMNLIPVFVAVVEPDSGVKLSSEHQEYKWVGRKHASKMLAWPGQIESLNLIHDYFKGKKENLNFIQIKL